LDLGTIIGIIGVVMGIGCGMAATGATAHGIAIAGIIAACAPGGTGNLTSIY
jgi:hypothetical protein